MGLRDWFARKTLLQAAIERAEKPGASLAEELGKLNDYALKEKADGVAVAELTRRFADEGSEPSHGDDLRAVLGLFQDVDGVDCPAFDEIAEHALPPLVRIAEDGCENTAKHNADNVLLAFKLLALYGSEAGAEAIVRAVRAGFQCDGYMWCVILGAFREGHPRLPYILDELRDPLPQGFSAVGLLDCANQAFLAGYEGRHPFDHEAGAARLADWLNDHDEESFSYAVSATAALPFVSADRRRLLTQLAEEHPSTNVRLEAAWAAAKAGDEAGIERLASYCLDVRTCRTAMRYLEELELTAHVPPAADDPAFLARAEFANWLAHPNELGAPPDEVEVVDARELPWPPSREQQRMWLLRYLLRDRTGLKDDQVGVGLVGSTTWCFFSYELDQRPPEDAYAVHAYWEAHCAELISEVEVAAHSGEYDGMLRQAAIEDATDLRVVLAAEFSPRLAYPQPVIGLAKGSRAGEPGWLVLDGPRSRWYAESEMVEETSDKTVLMIHAGRVLLGFEEQPERRKFFRVTPSARPPAEIAAVYERYLQQAQTDREQAKKLLAWRSPLAGAFLDYATAWAAEREATPAAGVCAAYEGLLAAAKLLTPEEFAAVAGSMSPLGERFDNYVTALLELGRSAEVPPLIETFRPHWDHNLGYGKLGKAAFQAGRDDVAEPLLVKLRQSMPEWERADGTDLLAEIWVRQGRTAEAQTLLLDALRRLTAAAQSGDEPEFFDALFQERRTTFLRLFPSEGEAALLREGVPSSIA